MKAIRAFLGNVIAQIIVFIFFFLILGYVATLASKSISAASEIHWLGGVFLGCLWLVIVVAIYSVIWYAMRPSAPKWLSDYVLPRKRTGSDPGLAEQYPGPTLSALICVGMLIAVFAATSISTILASQGVFTYAIESHYDKPMSELLFRLYMLNTIDLIPFIEVLKTYGLTPPVRPTNGWSQTSVLIFRTAIIGFAISVIVQWTRFNRETKTTVTNQGDVATEGRRTMAGRVVPMIHVPDVRATVDWYCGIGFAVTDTYGNDGEGLSFAILSFGTSQVMFNQGGEPGTSRRREVDLYVYTHNVDDLYQRFKDRVDVVEGPHDTFYGMRELIIRDLNRFWITFGQPSVFEMLMTGVREGNVEAVKAALGVGFDKGGLKPETLNAALAAALSAGKDEEIREMLKKAGAVVPPEIDSETLQSYAGQYKGIQGFEIKVTFKDGKLFAAVGAQEPLSLMAVDRITFRPIAFDEYGTIIFNVEAGKTVGCALNHASNTVQLKRVEETK